MCSETHLNMIRSRRCESVLSVMENHAPYWFLMVGESLEAFSGHQIPALDSGVLRARHYLRFELLADDRVDCVRVTRKHMHLRSHSYVPDSHTRISSSRGQNVERWVKRNRVNSAQMACVLPDDLIHLQIPAVNALILCTRKQIRVSWRNH